MSTNEVPDDYTQENAEQEAERAAQEAEKQKQGHLVSCPGCRAQLKVTQEQVDRLGSKRTGSSCPKCSTPFLLAVRNGKPIAVYPAESDESPDNSTETREPPRGARQRGQTAGEVYEPPADRRGSEDTPAGSGRDMEEFMQWARRQLLSLANDLGTGLEPLAKLQGVVNAIPHSVAEQVRANIGTVARGIQALDDSLKQVTGGLSQFVDDVQRPITEKLDNVNKALQVISTSLITPQPKQTLGTVVGKLPGQLTALDGKLDELTKTTRRLSAAFDPVIELQKKRLEEMNEARDKELQQLNNARDEELKKSNLQRHDELMKMQHDLVKTNEAIKATHEAGMNELRGKFDELSRFASRVQEVVTCPAGLRASFGAYFATLSQQDNDHRQLHLLNELPALLDAFEGELKNCRKLFQSGEGDDTARKILKGLEGTQSEIESWLACQGIERFAECEEAFDSKCHAYVRVTPTSDENLLGRIADVVRSGYRFRDTKQVLRKAEVVVWGK